jgi:hypothetical protein
MEEGKEGRRKGMGEKGSKAGRGERGKKWEGTSEGVGQGKKGEGR